MSLLWLLLLLASTTSGDPKSRADGLLIAAEARLEQGSIEDRRIALGYLTEAVRLEPRRADIVLAHARALEAAYFLDEAQRAFRRAWELDPRSPEAYAGLERSYRSEWLRTFDQPMLDSAIVFGERLVRVRPFSVDAWSRLVPLWIERGNPARAAEATEKAMLYAKQRPEPLLAYAALSWRLGEMERADSAFHAAIPKLSPDVRAWFTNPSRAGLESEEGEFADLRPAAQTAWSDSFWRALDPDPFTPQSEARLEYWSRVAQAVLLFWDARTGLDSRADLYVRYGRPGIVEYNPAGVPLEVKFNRFDNVYDHKFPGRFTSLATYPVQVQAWFYPELGMRVILQDRTLRGIYQPALAYDFDPASVPNPKLIAQSGMVQTGNGRALFSTQPPREIRMNVRGVLARFRAGLMPLLHLELEAEGTPADSGSAQWRIVDRRGRAVREGKVAFGLSACNPADRRTATISEPVPPGEYMVIVSARGANHKRGMLRIPTTTEAPTAKLDMSDVVVTCGEPLGGSVAVRFDADFDRAVLGSTPLTAYFEAYGLAPGSNGLSHFEYEVRVAQENESPSLWSRMMGKASEIGRIAVRREETQSGSVRRQFLSVPTGSLAPGKYRLLVIVRDLVSGLATQRDVTFAKL